MRITTYRPKEGADLTALISDGEQNICGKMARRLHDQWKNERKQAGEPRAHFEPNATYRFTSGLIFRLYEVEGQVPVLEFLADAQADRRADVLASIAVRLEAAGLDNKAALAKLSEELANPQQARQQG